MHLVMSQNPASRGGLCHENLNNIQQVVSQNPTPHVLGNFIQSIPHAVNHVKKSCSTHSKVTVINSLFQFHMYRDTSQNPTPHALGKFMKLD